MPAGRHAIVVFIFLRPHVSRHALSFSFAWLTDRVFEGSRFGSWIDGVIIVADEAARAEPGIRSREADSVIRPAGIFSSPSSCADTLDIESVSVSILTSGMPLALWCASER